MRLGVIHIDWGPFVDKEIKGFHSNFHKISLKTRHSQKPNENTLKKRYNVYNAIML